jgi:hypothetical protein
LYNSILHNSLIGVKLALLINVKDVNEIDYLSIATLCDNLKIVKYLVNNDANITNASIVNTIIFNHYSIFKFFIEQDVNINFINDFFKHHISQDYTIFKNIIKEVKLQKILK